MSPKSQSLLGEISQTNLPHWSKSKRRLLPPNLWVKFSLLLALVWLLGSTVTILGLSRHLNTQAERAIKERAEILLATTQAARDYTRDHIAPLSEDLSAQQYRFIQESIPNFAARTIFTNFQQQDASFQDFSYKEASPNPTNLLDLTDGFERQLFLKLQQQLNEQKVDTLTGYRTIEGEKLFYLARPMVMNDASCLECHGNPRNAPQYLIDTYGSEHGFGWKLNDVVAAQMVYVPANNILERGRQNLFTTTKTLLSIFGALFLVINLLLWRTVIKPLKILTNTAKHISSCAVNAPEGSKAEDNELETLTARNDEPGQLARAFQYMVYVLEQREQDLQRAVKERTRSLEKEMHDRQTAQDALRTYSHAVNHDLRNLAMGISSVIQGILLRKSVAYHPVFSKDKNARDPQNPVTVESTALAMIKNSCDRQLKLMNSLMEVQSPDIWRIALQPTVVNLRQLVETIETTYQSRLVSTNSTFDNQIPIDLPAVRVDANQIKRVFENLIDNALKYNPQGVDITLQARCGQPNPMVRCSVWDNGIGVDPAKSQELFELYTRSRGRNQAPGCGLGLYICKQIVEAHDGTIGVEASESKGTEFWFTLPLFHTELLTDSNLDA